MRRNESKREWELDKKNDEKLPLNTLRNDGGGGGGKCLFSIQELINLKWNPLVAHIFFLILFQHKNAFVILPYKIKTNEEKRTRTQPFSSVAIRWTPKSSWI